MVLQSDSTKETSLTGKELVGGSIDEIISSRDIQHYMDCLKHALADGLDFCFYSVMDHDFCARMERISSSRVRVIEHDVTGMDNDLRGVMLLFYR